MDNGPCARCRKEIVKHGGLIMKRANNRSLENLRDELVEKKHHDEYWTTAMGTMNTKKTTERMKRVLGRNILRTLPRVEIEAGQGTTMPKCDVQIDREPKKIGHKKPRLRYEKKKDIERWIRSIGDRSEHG